MSKIYGDVDVQITVTTVGGGSPEIGSCNGAVTGAPSQLPVFRCSIRFGGGGGGGGGGG
jgi:hypothetical protein